MLCLGERSAEIRRSNMLRSRNDSCAVQPYEAEGSALVEHYGVTFGTDDDKVILPTTLADPFAGVNRFNTAQGERASVITSGPATAIAGGVIARGDRVQLAADGRFVSVVDPAPEADAGYAVTAAAAADDLFTLAGNGVA